jgi:hypothetical protein
VRRKPAKEEKYREPLPLSRARGEGSDAFPGLSVCLFSWVFFVKGELEKIIA